ncbi:MAG: cobalamin-dependent protein, partial [Deltaproteobacteria bacterium]|nr:cobalamin-dependent protein [Deltaproteobacteria bacterium]
MKSPHEVIFVHEGKHGDPGAPIGLLPMGLLSMADWLEQQGHRARIVHHAIERALDPDFDVCAYIDSRGPRLVCLDLHWHQQSPGVIDLAGRIKEALPSIRVVLGGYTASAFAGEIMERFAFIDFVIRGDGEQALARLVREIDGGTLERVPNLTYREGGRVLESPETHVNSADDLGRYSFTSFHLLRHAEVYNQAGMMEGRIGTGAQREPGIFYCNLGRGCPYDCLFCGGSSRAQRMMSGRTACVYRPVEAMIRDLARMRENNLDTWYNTFHPSPDESRFLELFERIREERIRISMIHECLHIPSEAFIEQFASTFGEKSRMDFVLLSGSEDLRRRNKENFFGNAELLDCLGRLHRRGIDADLCFLTGLPHEQRSHVDESIAFVHEARKRHPQVGVNAEVLAIEPLSTMSLEPETCGIQAHARTFLDYVHGHAEPGFVGYTPGSYDAAEASRLARSITRTRSRRREGALVQLHDVSLWDDVMSRSYG